MKNSFKILKPAFFKNSTLKIAQALLGKYLFSQKDDAKVLGKIVETEAYLANDPGSHSSHGPTLRNKTMFGKAGVAYIYLIYGMYYCFNVVTARKGKGEAVLIRAVEPILGIKKMSQRRNTKNVKNLCSGPAKLSMALGITKEDDGKYLLLKKSSLQLLKKVGEEKIIKENVIKTKRIGLNKGKDFPYRFYIKDNPFISKK
jgi:DNA-3-methyladenine glycosylase